jgi:hypothetical protein
MDKKLENNPYEVPTIKNLIIKDTAPASAGLRTSNISLSKINT